jgi:chromosomal replication initiation ATPase DnaA
MASSPGSVEQIKRAVCLEFGLCRAEIESHIKCPSVSTPRMIGMALARRLTRMSFAQIGHRFGGRDHTTVVHACRRIDPYVVIVAQRLPATATAEEWVKAVWSVMEIPR